MPYMIFALTALSMLFNVVIAVLEIKNSRLIEKTQTIFNILFPTPTSIESDRNYKFPIHNTL